MFSLSSLLGFAALISVPAVVTASSPTQFITQLNSTNTTLPGHYLSSNITDRKFFENDSTCTPQNIRIRKEWRSLRHDEKMAFIDAELCMISSPNKTSFPGALSRFEDFQASHQQGTNTSDGDVIHYTGIFLTWHRWQIHLHEEALINECNYTGTIPFWDEAQDVDSGDFFQSNMWDDEYFGGNGSSVDNCVTTGSFANRTEHVGPLKTTSNYCFQRKFNETKGLAYAARSNVDECYEIAADDYQDFYTCMATFPHIGGHQGVGGIMTDVDSSPGDPVFYLHHAYLDRLYWQWQQLKPSTNLYAIGGNTTIHEPAAGWETLTADYEMSAYGLAEDRRVGDLLNIQGGYLCYAYEY